MKCLAVIPAHGGSKRIPRKNILEFCGKPVIGWSIEAAIASGLFSRIVVSTDDPDIADVARQFGAEVPFMRPRVLSDDYTPTVPVIGHAIDELGGGQVLAQTCCIYATASFVRSQDLVRCHALRTESGADYAMPVTSFAFPIQRGVTVGNDGRLTMLYPDLVSTRSQDLPPVFHDAGQFYFGQSDAWLCGRPVIGQGAAAHVIPRYRVQDIDTPEDWMRTELMFTASRQSDSNGEENSISCRPENLS